MPETGIERRHIERSIQHCNVVFSLDTDETDSYGTVFDISENGLGFCTSAPIREGQRMLIKNELPVGHKKGVVKWVKRYLRSFHRAGVVFAVHDEYEAR